jgi:hypothetical protein
MEEEQEEEEEEWLDAQAIWINVWKHAHPKSMYSKHALPAVQKDVQNKISKYSGIVICVLFCLRCEF